MGIFIQVSPKSEVEMRTQVQVVYVGGDSGEHGEGVEKARWGGRKAGEGCINEQGIDEGAGAFPTGDLIKDPVERTLELFRCLGASVGQASNS